jgi:hypothetical protein
MEIAVPADHHLGISVLVNHPDRETRLPGRDAQDRPGLLASSLPSKRLDRKPDAIPGGDDGGGEGTPYEEHESGIWLDPEGLIDGKWNHCSDQYCRRREPPVGLFQHGLLRLSDCALLPSKFAGDSKARSEDDAS